MHLFLDGLERSIDFEQAIKSNELTIKSARSLRVYNSDTLLHYGVYIYIYIHASGSNNLEPLPSPPSFTSLLIPHYTPAKQIFQEVCGLMEFCYRAPSQIRIIRSNKISIRRQSNAVLSRKRFPHRIPHRTSTCIINTLT